MGEKTLLPTPPKWFFFSVADEGEGEEKSGDEADKGVSNFFFFSFFYQPLWQTWEYLSTRAISSAFLTALRVGIFKIAQKQLFEPIYCESICSS